MAEVKTKQQAIDWLNRNYPSWLAVEFDPNDTEFSLWRQSGFSAGFVFHRQVLAYRTSAAHSAYNQLVKYYEKILGSYSGVAAERTWNRYVSLVDQCVWIVVRNPAHITSALLSINIEQQL